MKPILIAWFFLSASVGLAGVGITQQRFETSVACETARRWVIQNGWKNWISECVKDDPRSPWREEKK